MKKYLILENDGDLDETYTFGQYVKKLKATGNEVRFVFNAYNSAEEIIKQVNWPDVIAFTSTFIYIHPIFALAQAIGKYRKKPLEMQIMADNVPYQIDRLVSMYADVPVLDGEDKNGNPTYYYKHDEERAEQFGHQLQHISVFELVYTDLGKYTPIQVTTLSDLAAKWQAKIDADASFLKARATDEALTGRLIRIKQGILQSATSPQWANLKPGMVVPEISMLGGSERVAGKMQDRGAWVMGVGEPVKVLSSEGYNEFEYVVRNFEDLAIDLLKQCGQELSPKNFFFTIGVLKDEDEEFTPHWKATAILDNFGVPRRGNRYEMERKIQDFQNSAKV